MTTKARETASAGTKSESSAVGDKASAADAAETPKARKDPRACVVDDGTPHMGRATPGAVICSAHAMRYKADGTRR